MNVTYRLITLLLILFTLACSNRTTKEEGTIVLIKTDMGEMKFRLYDETPQHRDNFIKLAEEGYYDNLLFHRIIHEFMIQGGDPDSKNAMPGEQLGNGGPGYTIEAEFNPSLFHKKGTLAAARKGDALNPEKRSSGSQFYIVQGKTFDEEEINKFEERKNSEKAQQIFRTLYQEKADSIQMLQSSGMQVEFADLLERMENEAMNQVNENPFQYTEEQKATYASMGGTPHLDGGYTVFGEIIEGMEVLDSIAAVQTDDNDRPLENIHMKIKVLQK